MNFRKNIPGTQLGFQIVPMVDIAFLSLLWFVAASIYAQWETKIGIKVPTAKTGEYPRRHPTEVVVNIDTEGKIILNSVETTRERLRNLLGQLAKAFPDQPVVIRADGESRYREAIGVLDICRQAGISAICFSTVSPNENETPTPKK